MKLTTEQSDLLTEIMNVGIGRAAHALSELVQARVVLRIPHVTVGHLSELGDGAAGNPKGLSLVSQRFDGASSGAAHLAFERPSARALVSILVGSDDEDGIEAEREAVLLEVGNILINGVMGVLGNVVAEDISFDLPSYSDGAMVTVPANDTDAVVVNVVLGIEDKCIEGQLAVAFDARTLDKLWPLLDGEREAGCAR
ncbi:MAG: chemotaxis protein CheX [Deltaproteobacteria bacterium]|nr:chemotaxis protein CheX [Deltaproteobacteria bacterium]